MLSRILDTAGQLTNSPETSILLRNFHDETLYFAAATGEEAEWVLSTFGYHSEKQVPIDNSKAGLVYQNGESLVENTVTDHYSGVDKETKGKTKSMVCVPLYVAEDRLGVMQVLNKRSDEYTSRDQLILEYFADQASVAIRNAQLLENLLAHSGLYGAVNSSDELFRRMREINQDARTETLSVIFADMRGFTKLSQSLNNPVLVQELLSEFISMLSDEIIDEDGIVNKFLGDGVMGLFQGEDCSIRAVKSAFAMVRAFLPIKKKWDDKYNEELDFLDIGIGITTGPVIIGGIGSRSVRDYTAIGPTVNLAAAFEAAAREGKKILCDQKTYKNALEIISDAEGPEGFELKKPWHEAGVSYKCYKLDTMKSSPCVFISHSHQDREYVKKLVKRLNSHGIKTWYSVLNIRKGALWTAEIRKAISRCNCMAVIASKSSSASKWVRREVDLALTAEHLEDRILPIILDDTDLRDINEYLPSMQAIHGNQDEDVAVALTRWFKDIEYVNRHEIP